MVTGDLTKLNDELSDVMRGFSEYHGEMRQNGEFYKHSALYKPKAGESQLKSELRTNYLRVFADKNIQYTSPFPKFKVPTTGAEEAQRQSASIREKILYGVHRASNTKLLRALWAYDATVRSIAVAETKYDTKLGRVVVKRYDPRFCFWQMSDNSQRRITAFWAVFPITADECERRFGKRPTSSMMDLTAIQDDAINKVDGKDWFLMAIRWDENSRVAWCGNKIIEKPHDHQQGDIPIDVCIPFFDGDTNGRGAFYFDPLVPLQAEINETIKQRANIVRRMANPVIWGRGIINRQFDEVKRGLRSGGGGFVGLKQGGELGVLSISDTKMLDIHEERLVQQMMRQAGFGNAAFGEAGGANTSGDALAMVFNPTQRLIDHQNIAWTTFDEAINAKILRLYDKFGTGGKKFKLAGYSPAGTVTVTDESDLKYKYQSGGFDLEFDRSVIDGNYISLSIPNVVTPRDELAAKRLLMESINAKFLSRTTAYEEYGILSPEDELALLRQEQQDPAFNPQGVSQLMSAMPDGTVPPNGGAPAPQLTPPNPMEQMPNVESNNISR